MQNDSTKSVTQSVTAAMSIRHHQYIYVVCVCAYMQLQQQAIMKFCARHPELRQKSMSSVYKHLLHEDKYGLVYCFVPKGGWWFGHTRMHLIYTDRFSIIMQL